jgi:cation diffusion facilitator CzcD-associated flavoprotein CzcO
VGKRGLEIAIIGSGFAGLGAAIKLQAAGLHTFTIYERAGQVGGTWRDNTYPGCACDIPSHLYSFSFELNPDWSRSYPPQPEIEAYLIRVADRHALWPHLRFDTGITEARWDDRTATWALHTGDGEVHPADVVLNGTGPLSQPATPALPGIETFAGRTFHSAQWDHDHDLSGERVAVIGTGASAIQFVPQIAPVAGQVTVFQRSAPWVVPRDDTPFTPAQRRRFRTFPVLARLHRWRIYLRQELLALLMLGNKRMAARVRDGGRDFIAATIDDPELREVVTPTYEPGCKRLLISNDWYPTLNRDDVELVSSPIVEVTAAAVVTADGVEHAADTIIFGTGFSATHFLAPMKVFGQDGLELSEAWSDGAVTHLGIAAPGFPNLFLLAGPSSGLGHNSIVVMIECQLHTVMGAVERLRSMADGALVVRPEVAAASYAEVQARMARTVWVSGCHSWYQSDDGRIDTLWPGTTIDYWRRTRRFRAGDFLVVAPTTRSRPSNGATQVAEGTGSLG